MKVFLDFGGMKVEPVSRDLKEAGFLEIWEHYSSMCPLIGVRVYVYEKKLFRKKLRRFWCFSGKPNILQSASIFRDVLDYLRDWKIVKVKIHIYALWGLSLCKASVEFFVKRR